jgi:hypothetical protein
LAPVTLVVRLLVGLKCGSMSKILRSEGST